MDNVAAAVAGMNQCEKDGQVAPLASHIRNFLAVMKSVENKFSAVEARSVEVNRYQKKFGKLSGKVAKDDNS